MSQHHNTRPVKTWHQIKLEAHFQKGRRVNYNRRIKLLTISMPGAPMALQILKRTTSFAKSTIISKRLKVVILACRVLVSHISKINYMVLVALLVFKIQERIHLKKMTTFKHKIRKWRLNKN